MSDFASVMSGCAQETTNVFSIINSEFNNWNDEKATLIKGQIDNSKRAFQSVFEAARMLEGDIKKMQETANKVEEISRKTVGNDLF